MMKKYAAGLKEVPGITGDMLNERFDKQMLAIERISILLEDAKLDPNDVVAIDKIKLDRLMELLSAYEAFVEHFRHTTEDTVDAIKKLTTAPGCQCYGAGPDEDDADGEWLE